MAGGGAVHPCTVAGLKLSPLKTPCSGRLKKTLTLKLFIHWERYKIIQNNAWQMVRKSSSEKLLTYLQFRNEEMFSDPSQQKQCNRLWLLKFLNYFHVFEFL